MSQEFDVIVVGGGMVGAAAVLRLAQQGFSVAVIDAQPPTPYPPAQRPDVRVSAISCASLRLLQQIGAWARMEQLRFAWYRRLETWEWAHARVSFSARDVGQDVLGAMVENAVLHFALWQALAVQSGVSRFCPARVQTLQETENGPCLTLEGGETLRARLIIGADGAHSQLRQLAGIGVTGWQYRQSCLLISVCGEAPAGDTTWQEFTPAGPRAWLPLWENYATLVWYDAPAKIRQLQQLDMPALQQAILTTFPARTGQVTPYASAAFPLTRRHAQYYVRPGIALVGDAAHTIHPLAGQGVNLGYRDVLALTTVLTQARQQGEDWASPAVLQRYQRQRRKDNLLMQSGMDLFYGAFRRDLLPATLLRNVGLMAAQRAGWLKNEVLKYALGLHLPV